MIRRIGPAARSDDGAMALIVAILIALAFFGVAAIAVDSGMIYQTKRQLRSAADAGALAGVRSLPNDKAAAETAAREYVARNTRVSIDDVLVTFGGKDPSRPTSITVGVIGEAPAAFAQTWGIVSTTIRARATAVYGSPGGYPNVMPFGIMSKEPSATSPFGYSFNETVTLKQPAGQGASGNYQFVDLVGQTEEPAGGASGTVYQPLHDGGVHEPVYVGERYYTQTGINGQQVFSNLEYWVQSDPDPATHTYANTVSLNADGTVTISHFDAHRLIICPIIKYVGPPESFNWSDVSGSKLVEILGFSYFWIESIGTEHGTSGISSYIVGRFLRPVDPADALDWGDLDPFGAIGYKLVQ